MLLYFYNSWKLFWNQSIIPPLCSWFLKWQHSLTYILLFCQFQSNFWRQFKMSSNSFSWNCSLSLSFIDGVLLVGCCNFKRRGIPQLGTDSNLNCESGLPVGRSKKRKWQLVGVKVDWKCCFLKWHKSHHLHIFRFCYNWRHVRDYPRPQHCWIQRFPNLHLRPERKLVRCIKPPHCYPRSNNAQRLPHLHMMNTYSH